MGPLQRKLFYLNPLANCIDALRMPLLHGGCFPRMPLLYVGLLGIALALIGIWIIKKFDHTYPRLVS
jgi:ABC-type polysaccharide/polyol phosphate export permease